MSLFSALTASVSGMAAQSNKLSTISDNIANSSTAGYKEASTEFQDLIDQFSSTSYNANGVGTQVRYAISQQGNLTSTSSSTDLAIQGNGFFVVTDGSGSNYLTRAGSFTETADGELVNTAGYKLMGYSLTSRSSTPADGMNGLSIINLTANSLKAVPSTAGTFTANLQS